MFTPDIRFPPGISTTTTVDCGDHDQHTPTPSISTTRPFSSSTCTKRPTHSRNTACTLFPIPSPACRTDKKSNNSATSPTPKSTFSNAHDVLGAGTFLRTGFFRKTVSAARGPRVEQEEDNPHYVMSITTGSVCNRGNIPRWQFPSSNSLYDIVPPSPDTLMSTSSAFPRCT